MASGAEALGPMAARLSFFVTPLLGSCSPKAVPNVLKDGVGGLDNLPFASDRRRINHIKNSPHWKCQLPTASGCTCYVANMACSLWA
jgi:hypothetical protein